MPDWKETINDELPKLTAGSQAAGPARLASSAEQIGRLASSGFIGQIAVASPVELAAASQVVGAVRLVSDAVSPAAAALVPTTAEINATAGDVTICPTPAAGKALRVVGISCALTGAGTVQVKAGPTTMMRVRAAADGGGQVVPGTPQAPAIACPAQTPLIVNTPSGLNALGHVTYLVI